MPESVPCLPSFLPCPQALLKAGAEANAADDKGLTALHRACLKGHVRVVEALLVAGADLEARTEVGLGRRARKRAVGLQGNHKRGRVHMCCVHPFQGPCMRAGVMRWEGGQGGATHPPTPPHSLNVRSHPPPITRSTPHPTPAPLSSCLGGRDAAAQGQQ